MHNSLGSFLHPKYRPFSFTTYDSSLSLWQGRGAGVTITPYAAGRMIGAAVWRVSWQTEDNDIVYATAYNHNRER